MTRVQNSKRSRAALDNSAAHNERMDVARGHSQQQPHLLSVSAKVTL